MTSRSAKRLVAALVAVSVLATLFVGLATIGLVSLRSATGADPASAFTAVPQVPEDIGELVEWTEDPVLDRQIEPTTRRSIAAAWARAWHRIDLVNRTGAVDGVDVWFVGPLADQVASSFDPENPSSVSQQSHELSATFYSLDGSVIGLRSTSSIGRSNGLRDIVSTEEFEAVMLLSDGNWRMLHLKRIPGAVTVTTVEKGPS